MHLLFVLLSQAESDVYKLKFFIIFIDIIFSNSEFTLYNSLSIGRSFSYCNYMLMGYDILSFTSNYATLKSGERQAALIAQPRAIHSLASKVLFILFKPPIVLATFSTQGILIPPPTLSILFNYFNEPLGKFSTAYVIIFLNYSIYA